MNPFDVTIDLLGSIHVTDAGGEALDIAEGVARASDLLVERAALDAQFMFIGNGASQSIASHMAADFLKNGRMKAMAFTDSSLLTCVGNDLGFENLFAEPISRFGGAPDVLMAISSSGRSPNVIAGVLAARAHGMTVITITGFDEDNLLRLSGDLNFWVPSHHYGDVEVVHGAICHRILDDVIAKRG